MLVKGSPPQEFKCQRGLRQGDHFVTFLFLVVAKSLNGLMREAKEKKLFEGYSMGVEIV